MPLCLEEEESSSYGGRSAGALFRLPVMVVEECDGSVNLFLYPHVNVLSKLIIL
jgi:hypothetical protein